MNKCNKQVQQKTYISTKYFYISLNQKKNRQNLVFFSNDQNDFFKSSKCVLKQFLKLLFNCNEIIKKTHFNLKLFQMNDQILEMFGRDKI